MPAAAAASSAVLVEVLIVTALVSVVIIVSIAAYRAWQAGRAAAARAPCALFTPSWPFPDECLGTCTAGVCTSTGTRSYMIFWSQDTGCKCPTPVVGPTPVTGGGSGIAPVDGSTHPH